ncbi:hypothetical protein [Sphingomonas sp. 3-13AW]|uniref:hypothetical protein n=1 Tax=Sphingomonas sp. 3-13AW TaxID=3050450 RepID=UPI003BB4D0A4
MLVEFINDHYPRFREIRLELARARVMRMQSARLSSDAKKHRLTHERNVESLTTQRHQAILEAATCEDFENFVVEQTSHYECDLDEYDLNRKLLDAIDTVLARTEIPEVVVDSVAPAIIISAVESHESIPPKLGDVMLRAPQPYHGRPIFKERQPSKTGLPVSILGLMVGLIVSMDSEEGRDALSKGAIASKGRLFMPLTDEGWPQSGCDWDGLNDYLPLAARRFIIPLLPDLIPSSSWGSSLANMLVPSSWGRLRHEALDRRARSCTVCGSGVDLECHEIWEYAEPVDDRFYGLQQLKELASVCSKCHTMYHIGRERVRGTGAAAVERLRLVNRWSHEEASAGMTFLDERFIRRSRRMWALDLSVLAGTRLSVRQNWRLQPDGWIEHVGEFGTQATRILGVLWHQGSRTDVFDPVPPIHLVGWDDKVDPADLEEEEKPAAASSSSTTGSGGGVESEENEEESEEAENTLDLGAAIAPTPRSFTFEPAYGR